MPKKSEDISFQKLSEAFRGTKRGTELEEEIRALESEMLEAARMLEFETAAAIRDEIRNLKARLNEDDGIKDTNKRRRGRKKRSGNRKFRTGGRPR